MLTIVVMIFTTILAIGFWMLASDYRPSAAGWLHRMAHFFGLQNGRMVTKLDEDDYVWVGHRCNTCGAITGRRNTGIKDIWGPTR